MKTAITPSTQIPSPVIHDMGLKSQLETTAVDAKGRQIPELLKHSPRHGHPKNSVMSLAMAIGASSIASMAFSSPAVLNKPLTTPEALSTEPNQPTLRTAEKSATLTDNRPASPTIALKVEPLPLPAKEVAAIPVVQPIDTDLLAKSLQQPVVNPRNSAQPIVAPTRNDDFVYPLSTPTPVGSPFGWRVHPISGKKRLHAGMDFAAPEGAPVVAATGGRVVSAGWLGGYGKTIVIEHDGRLQTRYAHLSNITVQPGQELQAGTLIGAVGTTGRSTGPHLHFEMLVSTPDGWIAIDPAPGVQYALNNLQQVLQASQSVTSGG